MRHALLDAMTRRFLLLVLILALPVNVLARRAKYVKIIKPYAHVYRALDPNEGYHRIAHENETFQLEHKGKKWYRVWLDEEGAKTGFIALDEAEIVTAEEAGRLPMSPIAIASLVVIVLLGIVTIVRITKSIGHRPSMEEMAELEEGGSNGKSPL